MTPRRSTLLVSGGACAALALAVVVPLLLGRHVGPVLTALGGGDPRWLALAAAGFATAFVCTVGAWRAAFGAAGARIAPREAAARLGIGCLVNSVAPAKLGDAVKVALCARAIERPGRLWTGGGVYAGLAAARSLPLAGLVVVAAATRALPLWPVFALCGIAAAVALTARLSSRVRSHPRLADFLAGVGALARSPRAAAAVVGWSAAVQLARLLAAVAAVRALGLPHPVLAALVIVPALDLAGVFPLTPGSIGIGSGAVAVALASRGIGVTQALGVGVAIQALETLVSLGAGGLGALYLARENAAVRRWAMRTVVVGASLAAAAAVGALWLDLV
ncbi:MAG TPA: lysylphosphatidylglycerol synthase domain-containing protein [Gaiellaceae bacterium]|nr:lysylphosphatidylglycerol synthase domain-containing protein [Gaiellaceae bacterium]